MGKNVNLGLIEIVSGVIKAQLGDCVDSETFWDTLDGETDAMDIMGYLIEQRVEAQAFAQAARDAAARYTDRSTRHTAKADAITAAMASVLEAAGERKVIHPLGTISFTKRQPKLNVYDEDAIPSQLCKTTVKPDPAEIKKQIKAGVDVPGAELVETPDGINVRIK